ncbi:hypothetical protein CVT24_010689 [Panaeolus cyanescens]|uniref:Uncharacterized protein n=1 Tax=Panaeolus cyanescens TaxID=181874 RepID=A0A409WE98_9AGAR|nr:hypothetical protein CVT24_010689 [Panaeolus cyanescens]
MAENLSPSLAEVQEALAAIKPAASFLTRLGSLAMVAELAYHWRSQLDVLYVHPPVVNTIFAIRNAYHRIEEEHRDKNLDFKYPKAYHQVVEMTKTIHQLRDQQKLTQGAPTPPPQTAVSGLPPNVPAPVLPLPDDPAPAEPARPLKRARSSRIKSKAIVEDDSDLDIIVGPDGSAPKVPSEAPAPMVVDDGAAAPSTSKEASVLSASSSEVCWLPYTLVPNLDMTSPSFLKVKALSSSARNPHKRARMEESVAQQVTRAAYQDLELEVKSLTLRIQVLTRTRDNLKALMDAF